VGSLGIAGVVMKPLRPDALRQALLAALGRQRWVEIGAPSAAALELE
jgi:hypothetical protein